MAEHPIWFLPNRNPSITERIEDAKGNLVDLSGGVNFLMREPGAATFLINAAATPLTPVTADDPNVRFDWTAQNITDITAAGAGTYIVSWRVTNGGKTQDLQEAVIEWRDHSEGAGVDSSYVALEEFKSTLTLGETTFTDIDGQRALVAASRAVDYLTGQRFYQDVDVNQVRYYTATRSRVIRIDPLITLTSLQTSFDGINFDATWTVDTDFVLEPRSAQQDIRPYTQVRRLYYGGYWGFGDYDRFLYAWPLTPDSVKVTGKFGWPEVPAGVKNATTLIAARMFKAAREAPWGVAGFDEQGAIRISRYIPDQELNLGPYTRRKLFV